MAQRQRKRKRKGGLVPAERRTEESAQRAASRKGGGARGLVQWDFIYLPHPFVALSEMGTAPGGAERRGAKYATGQKGCEVYKGYEVRL